MSYEPNVSPDPFRAIRLLAKVFRILGVLASFVLCCCIAVGIVAVGAGGYRLGFPGLMAFFGPTFICLMYVLGLFTASELLLLLVRGVQYLKLIEENTRIQRR